MSAPINRILSFVSFGLLVVGISAYAVVKASKYRSVSVQPYTLVQQFITALPGKEKRIEFIRVVRKGSDGNIIETRERNGEQTFLGFSLNGQLVGKRKDKDVDSLEVISRYNGHMSWSEEALSKDHRLRKDNPVEWVEGVKCFVIRRTETEDAFEDVYLAPSLGQVLQMIHKSKTNQTTMTLKTVSLVFAEPERWRFEQLPVDLPLKYGDVFRKSEGR